MSTVTASPETIATKPRGPSAAACRCAARQGDPWPLVAAYLAAEAPHADGLCVVELRWLAELIGASLHHCVADLVDGAARAAGLGLHLGCGGSDMIVYHRHATNAQGTHPCALIGAHVWGRGGLHRLPLPAEIEDLAEGSAWRRREDPEMELGSSIQDETTRLHRRQDTGTATAIRQASKVAVGLSGAADLIARGFAPQEAAGLAEQVRYASVVLTICATVLEGGA